MRFFDRCASCGECCVSNEVYTHIKVCSHESALRGLLLSRRKDVREIIISKGSKCDFLAEKGCCLPYGLKPFRCRMYPLIYFKDGSLGVDIACRHGEEYVNQLRSGNVEAKEHFIEIISYLRSMPEEDLLELGEDSALRNEYIKIIIN